jgi:hypothetical protein
VPGQGLAGIGPWPTGFPPVEPAACPPRSQFLPSGGPSGSERESRCGTHTQRTPPALFAGRESSQGIPNADSASSRSRLTIPESWRAGSVPVRFGSPIREEHVMSCRRGTACIADHLEAPDRRGGDPIM